MGLMASEIFDIREAIIGDVEIIADMNIGIARETEGKDLDRKIITEGVKMAVSNPSLARYFVAENSGSIAGQTMVTYEWSDWRAGQIWWLQSVYVLPQYRSKGCFRSLYRFIKSLAEKDPLSKAIRLYVMEDNEIGRNVYSKVGMNHSGYVVYEEEWE
jgi:ribosomal protein S18 acetylase RimI-like enzyme